MQKLQLSVVIPCLNEKDTILQVVEDARIHTEKYFKNSYEIIVSDNGSTDGTLDVLRKIKKIKIVHAPVKGYGAALHWGILNSIGEFVIFADADMSYPFSNLKMFKLEIKNKADLILGSRFKGKIEQGAMPILHRYLGTPILTFLIKWLYKIPTSDCNSGMRIVKRSFYNKLNMRNSGMEWASELLLKTALTNGNYREVPILFLKDKRNRNPHLNTWSDGWRHLKSIILLKPILFLYLMPFFLFASLTFYSSSFGLTSLSVLLFVTTFFSYLSLMFLTYVIEGKPNKISNLLNRNVFVPSMAILIIAQFLLIYLLSDNHLGSKMILAGIACVEIIWVFMIETVKTHLVNRLP